MEGLPFDGVFAIKISSNLGLSKEGWEWIASKVGKQALKDYLAAGERALKAIGEWLVQDGVLTTAGVAAVVAGSFVAAAGLHVLAMKYLDGVRQKAGMEGMVQSWYVSSYVGRIFGGFGPGDPRSQGLAPADAEIARQLVGQGGTDAYNDAMAYFARTGTRVVSGQADPEVSTLRAALIAGAGGSADKAKAQLRQEVEARALKALRK